MRSNEKKAIITLDLEPDHAGQLCEQYSLWTKQNFHTLIAFLKKRDVPLTVFVVAGSLSKFSTILKVFSEEKIPFHAHSFGHNLNKPDSADEIEKSINAFITYTGHRPVGYRAPEGRISLQGLRRLKRAGFLFDASELASFWPQVHNIFIPVKTVYQPLPGLWEIPFTVITPFRIPFTLSWVKLLGWKTYSLLLNTTDLPTLVIFNIHLHDLWNLRESKYLSSFWRHVYNRHKHQGFEYFDQALYYLQTHGYQFTTMDNVLKKK